MEGKVSEQEVSWRWRERGVRRKSGKEGRKVKK